MCRNRRTRRVCHRGQSPSSQSGAARARPHPRKPRAIITGRAMEQHTIGKYRLINRIGQGAMGEVFKAHDPSLNRMVAVKTISSSLGTESELRRRFLREAQSAARLNHPNIITVYDFGEEQGRIYMAMELLEGQDLKDLIGGRALPELEHKLDVMEQVCEGLAFAHSMEVVHRDLKPGNVHVQPSGQVKILDFG